MNNTNKQSEKSKRTPSCGSCRYLNRHKVFEVPCVTTGQIPTSAGCSSFSPDVFSLVENVDEKNRLLDLSSHFVDMTSSQLAVLAELLILERKTRKRGFFLGQKVYLRIRGSKDYFSNFVQGWVLMAEKAQILLVDENCAHHWYLDFDKKMSTSMYTEAQFSAIREEMLERSLFIDPEIAKLKKHLEAASLGLVPSLKDAENADMAPKKKKSRKDLFDMAMKISRGYIKKSNRDDEQEIGVDYA
jgi:hypothetical protein